jgi:PPOX class probable F420-dependent enzyme
MALDSVQPEAGSSRDEFLRETHNVVLATNRRDGAPQLSPVWFLWTGAHFVISVGVGTAKAANIRRDPRISLCIDDPAGTRYSVATGTADWLDDAATPDQVWALLGKYMPASEMASYWEGVQREEPQRLFTLVPTKFVWLGF